MKRIVVVLALFAVAVVACDPQESSPGLDGTWVGTITTEGNVTTVVNESGSVWGGVATLVEEASIGVAQGAPWYMLGRIGAVAGSADRIYVADRSVPAVRVYSWTGDYLGDLGRGGQGPGEYSFPNGLAISDDGRIFILARDRRRVLVYSPDGEYLDSYPMPYEMSVALVVTGDGTPYGPVVVDGDAYYRLAFGMRAQGPNGGFGNELIPPRFPLEIPHLGGPTGIPIPHAPNYVWAMDSLRNLIAGVADEYRVEIARPDATTLVVERQFDPVPIPDEERDHIVRRLTEEMRGRRGDVWTWDGPDVPRVKPAFVKFMPTASGELWVLRPGPSFLVEGRTDLWRDTWIVDVFGQDGRFQGEVRLPADLRVEFNIAIFVTNHGGPFAFVRGDTVIMPVEDEAGTIMVKRYRLVLPGEDGR